MTRTQRSSLFLMRIPVAMAIPRLTSADAPTVTYWRKYLIGYVPSSDMGSVEDERRDPLLGLADIR
jgi:hypothetical protein